MRYFLAVSIVLVLLVSRWAYKRYSAAGRPVARGGTMKSNALLLIFSALFLIAAGVGVYYGFPTGNPNALTLSAVVLVGFASIVVLTATLVIVYQVLGLADLKQALALPEGSVRALIAFSLVLVFVCLAAFLTIA